MIYMDKLFVPQHYPLWVVTSEASEECTRMGYETAADFEACLLNPENVTAPEPVIGWLLSVEGEVDPVPVLARYGPTPRPLIVESSPERAVAAAVDHWRSQREQQRPAQEPA